jgi:hypothetical protein
MKIIKNIFGNSSDNNPKRLAHLDAKQCGICQEAFQKGQDDYRLPHCVACVESNRVTQADYWRQHFMEKRANTLSPDMTVLLEKLRHTKGFLESDVVVRQTQSLTTRSFDAIKADQGKYAASLEIIKSQVMEHLPAIVAELGLTNVVEEKFGGLEFVADMIVPAKISRPIQSDIATRAAIREIVHEELGRFAVTSNMLSAEASVQSRSHKQVPTKQTASSEGLVSGIQRISATSNLSRSLTANSGVFAPEAKTLEEAPIGEETTPTADQAMNADKTPSADVVGDVVRIPDEQGMQDNAQGVEDMGGMPTMNEGIIPNSEEAFYQGQPDLGAAVPPQDGGVNRVQQSAAPRVRQLKKSATKIVKPQNFDIFSFAGKIAKGLPVQAIKLDSKARMMLDNAPALNYLTASYTDGSTKTWNMYLADKGAIFASKDSEFIADSPAKFAGFIASDPGFTRWAYLPEELMTEEEFPAHNAPQLNTIPDSSDILEPEADVSVGEGDPSVNELIPTVLNPSPDNSVAGGIMNQQNTLLHNQETNVGVGQLGNEELLAETAVDMLPEIEEIHPGLDENQHMNLAISAAISYLNGLYGISAVAADGDTSLPSMSPAYKKIPGETHEQYIERANNSYPGATSRYRKHVTHNEHGAGEIPSFEQFLEKMHAPKQDKAPSEPKKLGRPSENLPQQLMTMERDKNLLQQFPPISSGDEVVKQTAPTGQIVNVPADKARKEQYEQAQNNYQFPSVAPIGTDEKSLTNTHDVKIPELSSTEPAKLPTWTKALDTAPEVQSPEGAKKYLPNNSYPIAEPLINAASLETEVLEVVASMNEGEFLEIGLPALIQAGYNDDEIMTAYASLKKEAEDFTVFSDYGAVTDVVHYKEPTEDDKHGLHNAKPNDATEEALEMLNAK